MTASAAERTLQADFNHSRYRHGLESGFYESYFQRANHPTRPLAFWIRYTLFAPAGRPDAAIGELWAIFFDGENNRHVVAKTEVPWSECRFDRDAFSVRVNGAVLRDGVLKGAAESRGHRIEWDLGYSGGQAPLFLIPPRLYGGGFPKAKSLVGAPMATFSGRLGVDGGEVAINGWLGSQNHNWGARHTDQYAYGQVCGFDNAPGSFVELATGRLRMGPFWTPYMTPLVLRHEGEEFALRTLWQSVVRARGRFACFDWQFRSRAPGVAIEGEIRAPREAFVGLRYYNPPGGEKYCLNSKIASCRLTLARAGRPDAVLETRHRAAFEMLTDDLRHGVEIRT